MNLSAYLNRINYNGSLETTLDNLKKITEAHKTNIPYSTLRGHGHCKMVVLDLEKAYDHVITKKMAGCCYEVNSLFVWLLQQLGYDAYFGQASYYLPEGKFTEDFYHMIPIVSYRFRKN